ncbi:MAG: SRPBCC domain-containing protein [Acidobacteriota bacterium]|nr:SRPBCC domain-containing protein [Acidobacteriota bacterium]
MNRSIQCLALICAAGALVAQDVKVTKVTTPPRRLQFEVMVPASAAKVWEAMSTTDGLITWLAPDAKVDLRPGGDWLALFPGTAGGGTIISFIAGRRIEISALAPAAFPTVRKERTNALFELEPVDAGSTLVRLTQTGWKDGPEWDKAFDYLAGGNAQLMAGLRQRFITGPVDWKRMFAEHK